MSDAAPFSMRLARNVRAAVKLLAVLWFVAVTATLIRGDPLIDVVLTGLALFIFVGPGAVLTYSALGPWRTRGGVAHYCVWVTTLLGAWLPLFLIAQVAPVVGSGLPLFDHPVVFFVAVILGGLVWGSITRSLEGARDRAQRAIAAKRSA